MVQPDVAGAAVVLDCVSARFLWSVEIQGCPTPGEGHSRWGQLLSALQTYSGGYRPLLNIFALARRCVPLSPLVADGYYVSSIIFHLND